MRRLRRDAAEIAGRLRAAAGLTGRQTDPMVALIAASALVRDAADATRNALDFQPLGVDLIDPWVA
jgi:toxin FitB